MAIGFFLSCVVQTSFPAPARGRVISELADRA